MKYIVWLLGSLSFICLLLTMFTEVVLSRYPRKFKTLRQDRASHAWLCFRQITSRLMVCFLSFAWIVFDVQQSGYRTADTWHLIATVLLLLWALDPVLPAIEYYRETKGKVHQK